MAKQNANYVTVIEFARLVGRSENTVRYWIRDDLIQYRRAGLAPASRIMIPIEEIERVKKELAQVRGSVIER